MAKQENIVMDGIVTKDLSNSLFMVQLIDKNGNYVGNEIKACISGKIRQNSIRILVGDEITCSLSPYDLSLCRITYRKRPNERIIKID